MHNFVVSVVIPAYNSEETICRALSSVFEQTLQPAEIIVVDDGSTDGTVSLVKNFYGDLKPGFLKLVELGSNHGASYARNVGWDMASGEFLAFLDSDDSWYPRKLEIQSGCMLEHDDLTLTAHRCVCFPEGNKLPVIIPQKWNVTPIASWQLMFSSCSLWTPSIIIKREIPYRFDSSRRFCEDRMLFLRLALNGYKIARLELPLACIYKAPYGEGGLSSHLWEMEKGELDVFYHLRQMELLSRGQEILLKSWSFLKYLRRLLIYRRLRRVV
jgi:glycosyltransferase involved in cell wall biosynthesis